MAQPAAAQRVGVGLAEHWKPTLTALRAGLTVADKVPGRVLETVTDAVRTVLPTDLVPRAGSDLPGPGRSRAKLPAGAEPAEVPRLGASPRRITAHHAGGHEEGAPRPSALGGY